MEQVPGVSRRKWIFVLLLCLAGALTFIWVLINARDQWTRRELEQRVQKAISLMAVPGTASFQERVDAARQFVNGHSLYREDEAFQAIRGNPIAMMDRLIAHAENPMSEPAHLECSARANIMSLILRAMGYRTRTLAAYDTDKRDLQPHSFLDVLNPETGAWESQDPFYDVYWKRASDPNRVSLAESAQSSDAIIPCGAGGYCSWDYISAEGLAVSKFIKHLDIITVTDKQRGVRYAVFTPRANLTRVYLRRGRTGTFCQVLSKACKDGFYSITKVSELPRD